LKEELARFDPALPIEAASTPPSSWFTDRGFHDLEMASVFRSSPLAVGSALQIPDAGDYFTGNIGRQHPFIVVRDHERRVRGFYNVCRHKVCVYR
jgi:choline monooxygenase